MYIGITLDTSKLHNMLPMLPPTMFRTMFILHLCFFFLTRYDNALKKKKKNTEKAEVMLSLFPYHCPSH